MAAELDQAGLVRMERQGERLEPLTHRIEKVTSVLLVLEAGDQIVDVSHYDHVAPSLASSPALGPEVEDVVQVDVGEERRDHRALTGSPVRCRYDPVFEDARLKPFADQAGDACVADAVLQEADQPFLTDADEGSGGKLPIAMTFPQP
jgi:hypothetical protein